MVGQPSHQLGVEWASRRIRNAKDDLTAGFNRERRNSGHGGGARAIGDSDRGKSVNCPPGTNCAGHNGRWKPKHTEPWGNDSPTSSSRAWDGKPLRSDWRGHRGREPGPRGSTPKLGARAFWQNDWPRLVRGLFAAGRGPDVGSTPRISR
jgi:hypothetical protein